MRPRTLRLRLVAAAAISILFSVGLLGGAVTLLIGDQLRSSLDRSLRTRAQDVARLAVSAPALLTAPGALDTPTGGRQLSVEVVDRHSRIVARSAALGGRLLPGGELLPAALGAGSSGYRDGRLSGEAIRVHAVPIADAGGPAAAGAVLVSSGTAEIDRTLDRLRGLIFLSALVAAALGALAAALLTRRGLRPLRRLSEASAAIARTGDPSRRLPLPPTRDELAELADTLNTMLAALERSRETERRFLADASHELRTPLTSLRGNLGYLARHGRDAETLADLEADASRLADLVDDLLALEREGAADRPDQEIALGELACTVAARENIQLVAPGPEQVAVGVRGDAGALERALLNLIDNARVHGPPGGQVTVELAVQDGRARLSVSDAGAGLGPEEGARAFDRFWRGAAAAHRPGSGLGLALVRAVAERHGGEVTVHGSRFTIDLPVLSPGPGRTGAGPGAAGTGPAAVREFSDSGSTVRASNQGGPVP
jgi:two-component system sensor histidine kinase MprB